MGIHSEYFNRDDNKTTFIYKEEEEGTYNLPDAELNKSRELFIINKSDFDLNVVGNLWLFGEVSSTVLDMKNTLYLFSDGEHWATY